MNGRFKASYVLNSYNQARLLKQEAWELDTYYTYSAQVWSRAIGPESHVMEIPVNSKSGEGLRAEPTEVMLGLHI